MSEQIKAILEEELIFGARDREALWRKIGFAGMGFGALGLIFAGVMAVSSNTPPPVLIPFDPSTGTALPNVSVGTISVSDQQAVVQSLIYAYVRDRETFNKLDNDLRIEGVFKRSTGNAATGLQALWNPNGAEYPPKVYGDYARIDVEVSSISPVGENRAQARITKRLTNPDGATEGTFLVTLAYSFDPSTLRGLNEVWTNPFGFTVSEYNVTAERFK